MVSNVFFATTILFMALGFFLLDECRFLIPFRRLMIEKYGTLILAWSALLFVNIYAALYFGVRKLLLKETGRKLAHVEKQLRTGDTIVRDLSERLAEED